MEENQDSYQIGSLLPDSSKELHKTIYRIKDSDLGDYKKLDDGVGPIAVVLLLAFKYCPHFYERVVGYTVSKNSTEQMDYGDFIYTFYERHIIKFGNETFTISHPDYN